MSAAQLERDGGARPTKLSRVLGGRPGRDFVARLFASPALKSWQAAEEPALRRALVAALDAVRAGGPLVLDLLVEFEAEDLEPRLAKAKVLHWRSRRSQQLGARVRRGLGIYSGESTLGVAVEVANGAELEALLVGTTLWDAELSIYPPPARPLMHLPDPHSDIPAFAAATAWSLHQDTGTESWLVTARGVEALDAVCSTLKRAFEQQGLPATLEDAPPAVYGTKE